jgi:citrate lyase beta subunit
MLEKSITTGSDVIIYDLEDSVSPMPLDKAKARGRLKKFLGVRTYFHGHIHAIGLKHFIRINNNAWDQ